MNGVNRGPEPRQPARRGPPTRAQGRWLIGTAAALAVTATALSLIPGPSAGAAGPSWPILDSRLGSLVVVWFLVFSAFLAAIGASAWAHGLAGYLIASIVLFWLGVGVEALSFDLATRVNFGGGTIYVEPFPQSWFPLVYSVMLLVFSPVCWMIRRHASRGSESPPVGPASSS